MTPIHAEEVGPTSNYRAYGIVLRSAVALPGLRPVDGPPDVVIRYGAVPEALPGATQIAPRVFGRPSEVLVLSRRAGRFWIRNGREIVVSPRPGAVEADLVPFLLSSCIGALLLQRGYLPLHASVVAVGDGCVGFMGPRRAGKSTTASLLYRLGYPLVADDVCALTVDAAPRVHPGYPFVKLNPDSAAHVDLGTRGARRLATDKLAIATADDFTEAPRVLRKLFVLARADTPAVRRLHGHAAMNALIQHTYRRPYVTGMALHARHIEACASLLTAVPVYELARPFDFRRFDGMAAFLQDAMA